MKSLKISIELTRDVINYLVTGKYLIHNSVL
ncbi:hypothetical protein BH11BAC3_BH11BAC3_40630 [soil metagenome]